MIKLPNEFYTKLCNALELVGQFCTDVCIRNNEIRQSSDDRLLFLELVLPSFTDDQKLSFNLSDVKRKLKFLKLFNDDIEIDIQNTVICFRDTLTEIKIAYPPDDVLVNEFVSRESLEQKIPFNELSTPIDVDLNEQIVERIKTLTDNFNCRKVELIPTNQGYSIYIMSHDKSQQANIATIPSSDNSIPMHLPKDVFLPFSECHFTVYKRDQDGWACCQVSGVINDIEVSLYTRVGRQS